VEQSIENSSLSDRTKKKFIKKFDKKINLLYIKLKLEKIIVYHSVTKK